MKPLGFLFVVIALLLPPFVHAEFTPQFLEDAQITHRGTCKPYYCLNLEKDGQRYIEVIFAGQVVLIFLIVKEEAYLVWARDII
jgi:hypothetical protein